MKNTKQTAMTAVNNFATYLQPTIFMDILSKLFIVMIEILIINKLPLLISC